IGQLGGIRIDVGAGVGTTLSQAVSVAGNSITSAGGDGIRIQTNVSRATGFTQALIVSTNTVTSTGVGGGGYGTGIALYSTFRDLPNPATQSVQVNGNKVTAVKAGGIYVQTRVSSATVSQALQIDDNTIVSAFGGFGILVSNFVSSG